MHQYHFSFQPHLQPSLLSVQAQGQQPLVGGIGLNLSLKFLSFSTNIILIFCFYGVLPCKYIHTCYAASKAPLGHTTVDDS